jgi:hypothetical protein
MEEIQKFIGPLIENVEHVIVGKREPIEFILVALLCEGHVLIEDVPGSGKTMLARSIAIRKAASSNSTPDRSSSTSFWQMRSTAPRRARRQLSWKQCRNNR